MSSFRLKRAVREPHPDPRVEARLQQVLSRQAAVRRTEARLADISTEQRRIDRKKRRNTGEVLISRHLIERSKRLHFERMELEAFISNTNREISRTLAALGDDALYLGPLS